MTRKEISPINESEPTEWEEFVINETGRKIAKTIDDLGRGCSQSAIRTIKHHFWKTADALKGLDEASDDFVTSARSAVGTGLANCVYDLGASVSPSEIRTIRHWFEILEADIIGEI